MVPHSRNADDKPLTLLEFDAHNGWISIRVRGEMNTEIAVRTLLKALQLCREKHCHRILFDARETVLTSTFMDGYDLAKYLRQKTGLDNRYKCAVIYHLCHYPAQRAQVMEMVAKNWDNYSLRMFSDRQLAVNWLKT